MPTPSQSEPDATTVRRIVRRVRPTPSPQLALFSKHSYHGFITDQDGDNPGTGGRPSPPRRGRECHPRPEVRRRPEPHVVRVLRRQRRLVGGTGDDPQPGPLSSGHRSGWAGREHEDPQTTVLLPGWTAHPSGPPSHPAYSPALALGNLVQSCPGSIASPTISCLMAPSAPDPSARLSNRLPGSRQVDLPRLLLLAALTTPPSTATAGRQHPLAWLPHPPSSQIRWDQGLTISFYCLSFLV